MKWYNSSQIGGKMVFISKNIFRKCKYCDKEKKKNLTSGRHKGYYTTCGSKECLRMQYDDHYVCIKKGRLLNPIDMICLVCGEKFIKNSVNHKRYCIVCVPDSAWRGRAMRYRIGKPQWEKMEKEQNGKCALCDRNPEVIDHCHSKGIVRGLLCNTCNILIRILDMDLEFLKKAISYTGGTYSIS